LQAKLQVSEKKRHISAQLPEFGLLHCVFKPITNFYLEVSMPSLKHIHFHPNLPITASTHLPGYCLGHNITIQEENPTEDGCFPPTNT